MDSVLHSCRCPNCGADVVGPIANVDDVKWSLGNLVLDPLFQVCDLPMAIKSAQEQIEYIGLQKQLIDKMEEAFRASYFSPLVRHDIKNVIEKMDQISDGPRRSVDRSHEQLSVLQREKHDAVAGVECDAGNAPNGEVEEGSVEPDVFPPPSMFRMD